MNGLRNSRSHFLILPPPPPLLSPIHTKSNMFVGAMVGLPNLADQIHEYTEPSDIDEILDEWIERRILRKRDRDDSRRGGRRGRGDSREGPIKKLKEVDGSVRGRAGGDSGDGVDENAREKLDTGERENRVTLVF